MEFPLTTSAATAQRLMKIELERHRRQREMAMQANLSALRLYGLPEAAPAVLNGTPLLTGALFGSGRREFTVEVSWDLPNLAPAAAALSDVTVNGARAGDLAAATLSVGVVKRRVP